MLTKIFCDYFQITEERLKGKDRTQDLMKIKHMYALFLRRKHTLSEIGNIMNKTHPSVMNGISEANKLISTDREFSKDYDNINELLDRNTFTFARLCIEWGNRTIRLGLAGEKARHLHITMVERMVNIFAWGQKLGLEERVPTEAKLTALYKVEAKCNQYGCKVADVKDFVSYEIEKLKLKPDGSTRS